VLLPHVASTLFLGTPAYFIPTLLLFASSFEAPLPCSMISCCDLIILFCLPCPANYYWFDILPSFSSVLAYFSRPGHGLYSWLSFFFPSLNRCRYRFWFSFEKVFFDFFYALVFSWLVCAIFLLLFWRHSFQFSSEEDVFFFFCFFCFFFFFFFFFFLCFSLFLCVFYVFTHFFMGGGVMWVCSFGVFVLFFVLFLFLVLLVWLVVVCVVCIVFFFGGVVCWCGFMCCFFFLGSGLCVCGVGWVFFCIFFVVFFFFQILVLFCFDLEPYFFLYVLLLDPKICFVFYVVF